MISFRDASIMFVFSQMVEVEYQKYFGFAPDDINCKQRVTDRADEEVLIEVVCSLAQAGSAARQSRFGVQCQGLSSALYR